MLLSIETSWPAEFTSLFTFLLELFLPILKAENNYPEINEKLFKFLR